MYMSSHPDTLVAYVRHFGGVKENITGAEMSAIDTKVRVTTVSPSNLQGLTTRYGRA
jgi:hypothetical protein